MRISKSAAIENVSGVFGAGKHRQRRTRKCGLLLLRRGNVTTNDDAGSGSAHRRVAA